VSADALERYRKDASAKPPFSYATLICMAMKAHNNKMALSAIYAWIRENFLYYRVADPSWQVRLFFVKEAPSIRQGVA